MPAAESEKAMNVSQNQERTGPRGIHGGGMASATKTPANANIGEHGEQGHSFMDAKGAIGKQFTEKGIFGGTAQAIGGPLDKSGVIGQQFTKEGMLGGSVQSAMGDSDKK